MVYNNGFPETYQNGYVQNNYPNYGYSIPNQYGQGQYPMMVQQQQPTQMPQNQNKNNNSAIIWVQGEAGAKAYPVAPDNKVLLMDSENPVLYVKSVNASGIPDPLLIYDLVQRTEEQPVVQQVDDSRLNSIEERLKKLENRLQNNTNTKQRRERNDG